VLKRTKIAFSHLKTKKQRLQLLHIHPRRASATENLMRLLWSKSNFTFGRRMVIGDPPNPQKPLLQAAGSLVLASEDALFFGINKNVTQSGARSHFEFKEKDEKFVPAGLERLSSGI